ncbi:hypothetical protein MX850_04975 [Erysipelothrix sp. Poltava]|nr:hypothetical protein MX850_04975 [Erysipelothrix sp. Poltava]
MLTFRRPHSRIVISYLLSILLPLMNGGLMFKIMQNETRLDYANVLGASVAVSWDRDGWLHLFFNFKR